MIEPRERDGSREVIHIKRRWMGNRVDEESATEEEKDGLGSIIIVWLEINT